MNRRTGWIVGWMVLFVTTVAWSADDGSPQQGALSGRIVTLDGKPIAGARVWLAADLKTPAETRADADGRFRLGPVDAACRLGGDLLVDAEGFARLHIDQPTIFAGSEHDLGQLVLTPGRRFKGQVLDVDGKPRANVHIRVKSEIMTAAYGSETIGPQRELATDAEGHFRTPPLRTGQMSLEMRVPERQIAYVSKCVLPGDTDEALEPIRLRKDFPLLGSVKDEEGQPIAGASVDVYGDPWTSSDDQGRFTLRGFGADPAIFQMVVYKEGYVSYNGHPEDFRHMAITLKRVGWIKGRAADADSGQPIRLKQAVLCEYERRNGVAVRRGCRNAEFEQPEPGTFRIECYAPGEYRLTLSADGYVDTETFLPPLKGLNSVEEVVVKMHKIAPGVKSQVPAQRIEGAITRSGQPVRRGWVSLWERVKREPNAVNVFVQRGRTVPRKVLRFNEVPIADDGTYTIDVPHQEDWYLLVEEPGEPSTVVGPLKIDLNEVRKLDIACNPPATIAGRVRNVPKGMEGHLWVVAFGRAVIKTEARVARDGTFRFDRLPPGEYGLKVGHDAFRDAEVPNEDLKPIPKEAWETEATPWKRAVVVKVEPDHPARSVELELPSDPSDFKTRVFMGGMGPETGS